MGNRGHKEYLQLSQSKPQLHAHTCVLVAVGRSGKVGSQLEATVQY